MPLETVEEEEKDAEGTAEAGLEATLDAVEAAARQASEAIKDAENLVQRRIDEQGQAAGALEASEAKLAELKRVLADAEDELVMVNVQLEEKNQLLEASQAALELAGERSEAAVENRNATR